MQLPRGFTGFSAPRPTRLSPGLSPEDSVSEAAFQARRGRRRHRHPAPGRRAEGRMAGPGGAACLSPPAWGPPGGHILGAVRLCRPVPSWSRHLPGVSALRPPPGGGRENSVSRAPRGLTGTSARSSMEAASGSKAPELPKQQGLVERPLQGSAPQLPPRQVLHDGAHPNPVSSQGD